MTATRHVRAITGRPARVDLKRRPSIARLRAGARKKLCPTIDPNLPESDTGVPTVLTDAVFKTAWQALAARDADLARVVECFGPPPLWRRRPSFATLVRIILEQQVSLNAARAVFNRLSVAVAPFSAVAVRRLDERILREAGLTRQKRVYIRALAEAVATGRLRLNALAAMPDNDVREALMQIKGIGPWTADIYLLMALRRADIWPRGDLALDTALTQIKHRGRPLSASEAAAVISGWRPWRSVAARILWHAYLSTRNRSAPEAL